MNPGIAEQLTRDLINFEVPNVSVIFVGNDLLGPHIYVVADGEVSCNDVVGFAAIGIGARHAESLFMMEKHWWNATISDTALLAYTAKKRSEIAPGVGEATDMFTIGPALGTYYVLDEERMQKLEAIYKKMKLSEARSTKRGRKEAKDYVEELQARTAREEEARAQSEPPTQQSSPPSEAGPKGSTNGGKTAPGGEKTEGKDT